MLINLNLRRIFKQFKKEFNAGSVYAEKRYSHAYHSTIKTSSSFGVLRTYLDPTTFCSRFVIEGCDYDLSDMGISKKQLLTLADHIHSYVRDRTSAPYQL